MLTPEFLWAQSATELYVTISVPNVKKDGAVVVIEDSGEVYFKGVGGAEKQEQTYELKVELLNEIDASASKYNIGARNIEMKIAKKDASAPFWPYLLKGGKNVHCKIDWDHWKDEDEDDQVDFGSAWDSGDMSNLPFGDHSDQAGPAGDDDDEDDDDDAGVPPLEPVTEKAADQAES
uniref:CS domain-containing protein n=1 Tax=Erythrolobus madagascarensis TaxID=708628 RepID=A0A7S0XJ58_9RHOD|mmetsp:Transcript_3372/g.7271  ORF Transcript_3372/g.7271 Transcript_3372/m.7271 type:complete len:177 (+) Transcript_3372:70-600(+)|eukprot:CAMPEP_0185856930 /NCGR_PEP_ID=MMETSP1354-20130828/29250_1 /TAXON_ID=708628 /ORGANISM="Erythrolobus madagascarensis, Strain CCMP3276" /LENGTH=176 /DNA_ID=CAMNT_0028559191 /DNA_START=55 /DNA_END=585 /DNA_ORIENTATION=+